RRRVRHPGRCPADDVRPHHPRHPPRSRVPGITRHESSPYPMSTRASEYLVVTVFVTVMAAANLSIAAIGPWFLPVTAFFAVGVVPAPRDSRHGIWAPRRGGGFWPRMIGMIAAAAVLSFLVHPASGRVALASVSALVASSLTGSVAFQSLFTRRWIIRSNGSN